jgi:hypothetical protein
VSPPVLLDLRLRALSEAGSGSKVITSVGKVGPGLRYWISCMSHVAIDDTGYCETSSQSSYDLRLRLARQRRHGLQQTFCLYIDNHILSPAVMSKLSLLNFDKGDFVLLRPVDDLFEDAERGRTGSGRFFRPSTTYRG